MTAVDMNRNALKSESLSVTLTAVRGENNGTRKHEEAS